MGLTIGQAGLHTALRRLDAAAGDVARAAQAVAPPSAPPAPAPLMPPSAAPAVPRPAADRIPDSRTTGADLPARMVALITASNAVMANLQVMRRADEATRPLIEDGPGQPPPVSAAR